jgi:endo-1,4-beta-D-glucanase Y
MKRFYVFLLVVVLAVSSILPGFVVPVTAATAQFPYGTSYPYGLGPQGDNQAEANALVLEEWNQWKSQRITSNGAGGARRVQRTASQRPYAYDTVSEGTAYGMLLSVYFDDKALFDDLWKYAKSHMNENGLLWWHCDANGNYTRDDYGNTAATDADEDAAIALIFAYKKWGGNYDSEARTLINNIFNKEVENGSILKPGDGWGGSSCTNPSYFAPAWYRIFAQFTGNNAWNNVADKCYEILDNCRSKSGGTGLVPDWCTASGTQASGQGYNFYYDAIRTPWRIAIDYLWFGTPKAKTVCDDISKFFAAGGVSNIGDGYTITGNKYSNNLSPAFISCIASGAMTGYSTTFAKDMYKKNIDTKLDDEYYGMCLRMFALLLTTGNFPNLYNYVPVSPSPSPSHSPSPSPSPSQTGYTVSGYVGTDFQYGASVAGSILSGFKVEVVGKGLSAVTDSNGYFSIPNVQSGSYTLKITKTNFLAREVKNVYVSSNTTVSTKSNPLIIWVGDIGSSGVQNNAINLGDVMTVCTYFNSSMGDGKYDVNYDINLDGAINISI